MSGIGIILVLLRLAPFLGQAHRRWSDGDPQSAPVLIQGTQPMELLLAVITLIILWFTPSALKKVCLSTTGSRRRNHSTLTVFSGVSLRTIPEFSAGSNPECS